MVDLPRMDAQNKALFYTPYGPADFEKDAQEQKLSQDVREWPALILQAFASQHPYAFQSTAPEIEFEKIDEQSGSAFGAIILRKPYQVSGYGPQERLEVEPEKVAVPIIIEAFRLKPFHVFIHGEKVMPLTETRFAEMGAGSPIARGLDPYHVPSPTFIDKMVPPTVGYLGNLYGNYSLFGGDNGYGSQVPMKGARESFEPRLEKSSGSADPGKESTFIGSIIGTVEQSDYDRFRHWVGDERILSGFALNRTLNIVREILGAKPTSADDYRDFIERAAPCHLVCLKRISGGKWRSWETNDYYYKPVIRELSSAEVVERYGSLEPSLPSLMQESDEILLESDGRSHVRPIVLEEHETVAEKCESDGHYLAVTKDGSFVEGQLFTDVRDYNGNPYPVQLFLTGNAHALQECMVGERLGDVHPELSPGSVEVGAEGTFVGAEEGGGQFALLPFKVTNVGWVRNYLVVQALGLGDEKIAFVLMPGVTRLVNATGVADTVIGDKVAGNVFFVPPGYHFLSLGKRLRLMDDPREVKDRLGKRVFFHARHLEPFDVEGTKGGHGRSVRVIATGRGTWTLKGDILETLHRDRELQDLSSTECHWILSVLGVALEDAARITALALDRGECNVSNLRPAKDFVRKGQIGDKSLAELAAIFRRNLTKEASTFGDPKAVDAMLSLNFVNENNLLQFLDNLPMFRETEEKLAELYLYAAMGLKEHVPEQAVITAMKAVNEVNEGLEHLAAMLRTPPSQAPAEAIA